LILLNNTGMQNDKGLEIDEMEMSEIRKLCMNCMHMSKEDEFCPVCGKAKKGLKSYGRALEPGTILN